MQPEPWVGASAWNQVWIWMLILAVNLELHNEGNRGADVGQLICTLFPSPVLMCITQDALLGRKLTVATSSCWIPPT